MALLVAHSPGVGEVMGSNLGPNRVIAKNVKRRPNKGRAIKGLVVCNSLDLEPWDLLNGLALGCYQPSPEV